MTMGKSGLTETWKPWVAWCRRGLPGRSEREQREFARVERDTRGGAPQEIGVDIDVDVVVAVRTGEDIGENVMHGGKGRGTGD